MTKKKKIVCVLMIAFFFHMVMAEAVVNQSKTGKKDK